MALATTETFEQMVLETSENGTSWTRICGVKDVTVNYETDSEEDMIPDCEDESLPHTKVRSVTAIGLSVQGQGVWAQESHETMLQWWLTGEAKRFRIGHLNAAIGDVEFIASTGILTMEQARQKGRKVTANITISSASAITTTDQTT